MHLRKLAAASSGHHLMNPFASSMPHDRFTRFSDFYSFYLSEHRTTACRRFHFLGTFMVIVLFMTALLSRRPWLIALCPVAGYAFAWIGHFVFERNSPATFEHPWYSLIADFVMFRDMLIGRIKF
jgi:hypothetical protein